MGNLFQHDSWFIQCNSSSVSIVKRSTLTKFLQYEPTINRRVVSTSYGHDFCVPKRDFDSESKLPADKTM